jgi:hypothetical protein
VAANFVRQSVICCAAVFELLLDWALAVWAWIEKTCRSKDPVDHCRGHSPCEGALADFHHAIPGASLPSAAHVVVISQLRKLALHGLLGILIIAMVRDAHRIGLLAGNS